MKIRKGSVLEETLLGDVFNYKIVSPVTSVDKKQSFTMQVVSVAGKQVVNGYSANVTIYKTSSRFKVREY
ncbi:hypothetical protein VPFG_00245 [Vibrio phage nt-1]|uniref:Uncharacterized protein n=1 Tax=Vibrio phage nt-1 TaxID=115992 RepID=R9TFI9_9CAUD|nr:hypothetical protein VPFG_00245 [Vibrio phage nt-1]AGN30244.1 hypothetical protein VPFG_00245 [Vibrio phage nt-1]